MTHNINSLVDTTIKEFGFFDLGTTKKEYSETSLYLRKHRHEYIRTLHDIMQFNEHHNIKRILEIGAFFGVVSICLSKLGFQVCAIDIPEYMSMPEQKERFGQYGIETASVRLQNYLLPFQDDYFDTIIMCEVLEHLNFNPLPLIKEINRVGAFDSLFYLSLPNLAYYRKRLKFLFGNSIMPPINSYFKQLDPNYNVIAEGHWREYTGTEIVEILEPMGYKIYHQYYFSVVEQLTKLTLKNQLTRLVFHIFPSFKENLTTLAIKKQRTDIVFHIPNTVHKTLELL